MVSAAPSSAPSSVRWRGMLAPLCSEVAESDSGGLWSGGGIDSAQPACNLLSILPGNILQAVAHLVNDAQLHPRVRVNSLNRLWQAFKAIHAGNEAIFDTTGFELIEYAEPELAPSDSDSRDSCFLVSLVIVASMGQYSSMTIYTVRFTPS